ncbi:hypothetical protein Q0Z83_091970 [Actinoplanes sichuanensis]|uniref:Serine/threonine protein kinase n=1 Tax=Actinoplanes sichuanensis TaxID=512349 RepID=A0ABW4AL71_9ACTN|nr:hypothetical protein [Actinoplanes sichuanensis]BEL11006.1 hypothetical protein Q0Z83_091970 [Actinoplanes sichuanensis]
MSDDFTRLRDTMGELAELGGDTDLHDRVMHTSRRLGRRRRLAATAAVAAVAVVLAAPIAWANGRQAAPPAVATQPSPSLVSTTPPGPVPSPSTPSSPSTPASPRVTKTDGCPIDEDTFKAVLADGRPIKPGDRIAGIECHQGYAAGRLVQATPDSDPGTAILRYDESTGRWQRVGSGSAEVCRAYLPRRLWNSFDGCGNENPAEACWTGGYETIEAIRNSEYGDRLVTDEIYAVELACGPKYAVVRLPEGGRETVVLSWSKSRQRWSVVAVGSCAEVVTSRYADPAICRAG